MAAATLVRNWDQLRKVLTASEVSGVIRQHGDGRASYMTGLNAGSSGDQRTFSPVNQISVPKAANIVFLDGQEIFWDRSADNATYLPGADRDFLIGTVVGDAQSADTTCTVNLNNHAEYLTQLQDGAGWNTLVVKTVVGSTTVEVPDIKMRGGSAYMILGATSEAQKVDLLSTRAFAVGARWIAEFLINIHDDGSSTAIDFNVGVANGTHASDADAITEHCFFHMDANVTAINAQSKDGTTTVAATDTTKVYALDTQLHLMIDGRNPADIQMYVNCVNVLPNSVFRLDNATGPLKLLVHIEKTANAEVGEYRIDRARVRLCEQLTP